MGFFDKLKSFGSKIVKGVRKGWDFVKNKVVPIVRKVAPFAATAAKGIATALGHPEAIPVISGIHGGANKVMDFISSH